MRLTIRTSENMERYTGKSYLPSMMCSQEIVHNHNTLGKKSVGIDISTTTKGKRKETHTGVSLNGGTPKSSISIGISIINHPFWGFSPYFWKHPHTMQHKKKTPFSTVWKPSYPWGHRGSRMRCYHRMPSLVFVVDPARGVLYLFGRPSPVKENSSSKTPVFQVLCYLFKGDVLHCWLQGRWFSQHLQSQRSWINTKCIQILCRWFKKR